MEMMFIYAMLYVAGAWAFFLIAKSLAKRATDEYARQAFEFALSVAWPLTLLFAFTLVLLVLVAGLHMGATWVLFRRKKYSAGS